MIAKVPAVLQEAARALTGERPWLPPRWYWGDAAPLHRARAEAPEHYPARLDGGLYAAHAALLIDLFRPDAVIDLAAPRHRAVRAFLPGGALDAVPTCVVHDTVGARLISTVRSLAEDFPRVDVRGALGGTAGRLGAVGRRLLLVGGWAPDGPDAHAVRGLAPLAARLRAGDVLVFTVDLGADLRALRRACRDAAGRAEALHRAAVAEVVRRLGGSLDERALRLEADCDARRGRVRLRLVPRQPTELRTPWGARPLRGAIHLGDVVAWERASLRRVAAAAGLELVAWLPDPEERRALVALAPSACRLRIVRL